MSSFTPTEWAFIDRHRVARLATSDLHGAPHIIPIVYACEVDAIVKGYHEFNSLAHQPDFLERRDTQEILKQAAVELMDKYRLDVLLYPFKSMPPPGHLEKNGGPGQPVQLRDRPACSTGPGRQYQADQRTDRDRVSRTPIQRADAVQAGLRV